MRATGAKRRRLAACAVLVALAAGCTSGEDPVPHPSPTRAAPSPSPAPPDPCAGEGWDEVPPLAQADGPIHEISVVVTRRDGALSRSIAGSESFHVRVRTGPGLEEAPTVYIDVDGRGSGGWTHGSSVSAATWNLRIDAEGVHRHVGTSQEWSWERIDVDGHHRWSADEGLLLACVPTRVLGSGHRVAVGVEAEGRWLPRALLPGLPFPPVAEAGSSPVRVPDRLAIAYGYRPWVVRDCTDRDPATMACASLVYGAFRHVVFAAGLEEPSHRSHAGTRRLVERLRSDHPDQEVWGYVSLRRHGDREHTVEDIATRSAAWKDLGATGIFLDEADLCPPGSSACTVVGVTRESQTAAVRAIHALGMPVFANGFSAPDVLQPLAEVPPALGAGTGDRPADMYLLENPTLSGGGWRTGIESDATIARMQAAIRAAAALGIRVAAVDTTDGWVEDDSTHPGYVAGWWRAVQAGAEAYGFTNEFYSAPDAYGMNLAILGPPVPPERFEGLAFASLRLRLSDDGRRISRDVVDCEGRDVGAVVTRMTDQDGTVSGELALRADRPACP